jgi:hypothetical protein
VTLEYVPGEQAVQTVAPVFEEKAPALQLVHTLASAAEYHPTPHEEQAVDPVLPVYLPEAQLAQSVEPRAPVVVMYLPEGQLAQLGSPVDDW